MPKPCHLRALSLLARRVTPFKPSAPRPWIGLSATVCLESSSHLHLLLRARTGWLSRRGCDPGKLNMQPLANHTDLHLSLRLPLSAAPSRPCHTLGAPSDDQHDPPELIRLLFVLRPAYVANVCVVRPAEVTEPNLNLGQRDHPSSDLSCPTDCSPLKATAFAPAA